MMPTMSILMSEVFPIDSNAEGNPWPYCRQVSDQSYQQNSSDAFNLPFGDFDPLPLHPDHGNNERSDPVYEKVPMIASLEPKMAPAMQLPSDVNVLKRRRDFLLRELRMLLPEEGSYQNLLSTEMNDINFQTIRPTKRARTVADGSNDGSIKQQQTPIASQRSVPMAMKCDAEYLSDYQCLIRQQIEIFEASEEDVKSRGQGHNTAIVGQVGIRCKHCASTPASLRSRGSSYFTSSMNGIYQAAQKMTTNHFSSNCLLIPESVKESLLKLKNDRRRAPGGKAYWAEGARILGVRETKNGGSLHFEKQDRQEVPEQVASATKK